MTNHAWSHTARAAMRCVVCILAASTMTGCARFSTEKGVASTWRAIEAPVFERGATTEAQVLEALGPPSQIIALNDGSAYYYLKEQGTGRAVILLVYNTTNFRVTYDRAVFFFDRDGVLKEYTYSKAEEETMNDGR